MLNSISCKPGSYIEIVPLGLPCTLQYTTNGILQKIIVGFNHLNHKDKDVLDSDLTIELKRNNVVPSRINITAGTTWVKGVFYTKKQFKDEGILPECIQKSIIKDLKQNMKEYTFYAGDLKNDSLRIAGATLVINRLTTSGFKVLPGYQVYDDTSCLPIKDIMKAKKSPFAYPFISGLLISESAKDFDYVPLNLNQKIVASTDNFLDHIGYVHTKVSFKDGSTLNTSYTEIVMNDVQSKSIVILDEDKIVHSRHQNSLLRSRLTRSTHCSVCGKVMTVPITGYASCADSHCLSKLYPIIKRFTTILLLPEMSFEEYQEHVKNHDITCLIDILLLDKYKDIKIECTLSALLSSIVPFEVIRSSDFFPQFTNYLGSIEAFDYYIQNPDCIVTDLNLNKLAATGFSKWLKDPYNVVELEALLKCDQIKIKPVSPKFEGSPIFRNKTICITGKFKRGTLEDIISILKSYSANVTTKFDNTVNCVVIGHFEDENKQITELATSYHVPIYAEDDFFKSYEIDLDIKKQRDMLDHYLK